MKVVDRSSVQKFRTKFQKVLDTFCKEEGLSASIGTIRFNPMESDFRCKIEFNLVGSSSAPEVNTGGLFTKHASRWGMEPSDFGRTFSFGGREYEIVGCKPKAYKNSIVGRDLRSGKSYVFDPSEILRIWGRGSDLRRLLEA